MALKIVWTPQAQKGLENVIEYLEKEWTFKEILSLEKRINDYISLIKKYPEVGLPTPKHPTLRKGLIDKNNFIIYRIKNKSKTLEIIDFRGTKQRPKY